MMRSHFSSIDVHYRWLRQCSRWDADWWDWLSRWCRVVAVTPFHDAVSTFSDIDETFDIFLRHFDYFNISFVLIFYRGRCRNTVKYAVNLIISKPLMCRLLRRHFHFDVPEYFSHAICDYEDFLVKYRLFLFLSCDWLFSSPFSIFLSLDITFFSTEVKH